MQINHHSTTSTANQSDYASQPNKDGGKFAYAGKEQCEACYEGKEVGSGESHWTGAPRGPVAPWQLCAEPGGGRSIPARILCKGPIVKTYPGVRIEERKKKKRLVSVTARIPSLRPCPPWGPMGREPQTTARFWSLSIGPPSSGRRNQLLPEGHEGHCGGALPFSLGQTQGLRELGLPHQGPAPPLPWRVLSAFIQVPEERRPSPRRGWG